MSTTTASLTAGLQPNQWRVLNALFDVGTGGVNVATLTTRQLIGWPQLIELEAGGHVMAYLPPTTLVNLADLHAAGSGLKPVFRLQLTPTGHRLVTTNPANQVVCVLGSRPNCTAPVRDLKGEGMADDVLIRRMDAAGLVKPANQANDSSVLDVFKHLPHDLRIRLTGKGRQYFPR